MKVKKLLTATLLCTVAAFANDTMNKERFTEKLYADWGQSFTVDKELYSEDDGVQKLVIFENPLYGTVLALDGIIQTTKKDEFFYHEMITHTALLSHDKPENVLIVGGGDGGTLREVLRHKNVKEVTLVEIDGRVIKLCKQYFPEHSKGAFNDPRTRIVIQDAAKFVLTAPQKFDVIIADTTDPIGPGAALFTPEFFANCKKALKKNGIFVNQCGVPFMQTEEMGETYHHLKKLYGNVQFCLVPVPTYVGGFMCLGWASDKKYNDISVSTLEKRLKNVTGEMRYYTPEVHKASFALPLYMQKAIAAGDKK